MRGPSQFELISICWCIHLMAKSTWTATHSTDDGGCMKPFWWRVSSCVVCVDREVTDVRVAVELETVHVDPNKPLFRFWWRCGLESLYLHHCWSLISLWAAVPVHPWDVGLGWGLCELPHQTVKIFLHWAASTKFNWGNVTVTFL